MQKSNGSPLAAVITCCCLRRIQSSVQLNLKQPGYGASMQSRKKISLHFWLNSDPGKPQSAQMTVIGRNWHTVLYRFLVFRNSSKWNHPVLLFHFQRDVLIAYQSHTKVLPHASLSLITPLSWESKCSIYTTVHIQIWFPSKRWTGASACGYPFECVRQCPLHEKQCSVQLPSRCLHAVTNT